MTHTFVASRISGKGNAIFPDKLTIDDDKVTYYKGKIIGYDQSVIMRERIGSVTSPCTCSLVTSSLKAKAAKPFMQKVSHAPTPNGFWNYCHKLLLLRYFFVSFVNNKNLLYLCNL